MPNPESFNSFSSSAETTGEDAKVNQARGEKVNQAVMEQDKSKNFSFEGMTREQIVNFDVSKLSPAQREQARREILAAMEAKSKLEQEAAASAAPETSASKAPETVSAETARATLEKAKKNPKAKGWFSKKVMAIGLSLAILIGGVTGYFIGNSNKTTIPDNSTPNNYEFNIDDTEKAAEDSRYSGELSNGVHYDYTEYADYEHKTSQNAFGYDKSDCFGNREATEDAWMEMANKSPEYMSSYVISTLTDAEKAELGIDGWTETQLDDYLSNADNIDGGAKQQKIMEKLNEVAEDKENTFYDFYYEDDTECSYYIVFNDANGDGRYTPDELEIGYSIVDRNGAPQVDVYRMIDGKKVKVLDLNMQCGFQPNTDTPPDDIPFVPTPDHPDPTPDDPTPDNPDPVPPDPVPDPDPEWGKSGDPHSGEHRQPSDKVDPNSEVTKEQNDNTNKGNEGRPDVKPGSSSTSGGSSSTNPQRISGGSDQSGGGTAGTNNSAPKGNPEADKSGNNAQKSAQETKQAGGNNNSDAAEEKAVENGDF